MSRAVTEMRGSSFLSLRAYGKYGNTAVRRRADACLSASRRMSSSTMCSESGGAAVCTTNTSCSRTFSSIFTFRFSFEKRRVVRVPRVSPRHWQISSASAGWDDPEKTFNPSMQLGPPLPAAGTGGCRAAPVDHHERDAAERRDGGDREAQRDGLAQERDATRGGDDRHAE